MQHIASQCTNCGAFARRSLHHEEEYQSSVFLERLRTSNFPATDEEISHIRDTILPTVSDDISSIDSRVASLHQVIRSMEEERERLINVQTKYNNLVSLHRTLPLEIWSEIFLYTLSSASDSNAFDASGSIWKVSHVCQRWRNIALSLGSFWSTMIIQLPKAAQHEADVQRLETVIQRSRERLLDVSLRDDIPGIRRPDSNLSILKPMLDIVLAESYRWQKLDLSDYRGSLNMLYAPLHNRLPRLESVGLQCAQLEPREHSVASVFKDCPRLTKVSLGAGSMLSVEFPWDRIKELDLAGLEFDGDEDDRKTMRLIARCPSLETLTLPYWYPGDDEDSSPYTPITCPNIRKLDVTSVSVINALTLPRLREGLLNPDPTNTHYNFLHSFKELLIRSSRLSALTRLSLVRVPLAPSPDDNLLSILSQTHSLTFLDLAVSMPQFDDATAVDDQDQIVALVNSLKVAVSTETVTFLPLLSSLFIQIHNHNDSSKLLYFGPVGSFASTLKSRWEGDDMVGLARLRTCHFAVQAKRLNHDYIYRGDWRPVAHVFNEAERLIFNGLIDNGMDLAIRVTSVLPTENVGGDNVLFAVPS
ncbi:hypothetical protein BDZ89DRAFT_1080973 [Hymenopellis radicata]|nr:hypothetical protein BDZ89DRAFT_1080973 [Hymenopellis radicata]